MMRFIFGLLALLAASQAYAQGTLPVALTQQFSFTGCTTAANACGTPLSGGLLYFYQAGTVATQQNSYQDTGLTIQNPWPLVLDANGRIPQFYLANGSVHARLTDANGVVQFDYPSLLVIGPSGGSGGSGVDPTTVLSTGDIKFRATSETVTGWVKLNSQTIGNAVSGASGRAASDTQALFVYLWTNCTQAHCPVSGGSRGASALADYNANKTIQLPDWRARTPVGLDDMGNTAAGRLLASNITSGGGDGVTTPLATGGESNHTLLTSELAVHSHANVLNDPSHAHGVSDTHSHQYTQAVGFSGSFQVGGGAAAPTSSAATQTSGTNSGAITVNGAFTGMTITNANAGSGAAHNVMDPFLLGTWFMKL